MDVPVNAHVECADGPAGRSTHVIIHPRHRAVTHVVVEEKSWPHITHIVPLDLITRSNPHTIWLRCTSAELAALDPFVRDDFVPPGADPDSFATTLGYSADQTFVMPYTADPAMQVPPYVETEMTPEGELSIERGADVMATDGKVGRIDEFLIDPTNGAITHLVLRKGHLWGQKDVTIPMSDIDRIQETGVYLKLDKAAVGALPTEWTNKR